MAAESSEPEHREYESLSTKLLGLRKEHKIPEPRDVYKCAALLTRWDSNGKLPFCMLCQKWEVPRPSQLGHVIPHSVTKLVLSNKEKASKKEFLDMARGVSGSIGRMGYRTFCSECEKKFNECGEVNFAQKLVKLLVDDIHSKFEVDAKEGEFPWLYYCITSIVWRCLALTSVGHEWFLEELENMRHYLLNPDIDRKQPDIALFVPNKATIDQADSTRADALLRMCSARCLAVGPNPERIENLMISCGPLHIFAGLKGFHEDFMEVITRGPSQHVITKHTKKFTFESSERRLFLDGMSKWLLQNMKEILSASARIPSWTSDPGDQAESVNVPSLNLLPQGVDFVPETNRFRLPSHYQELFKKEIADFVLVGFKRGREYGCFVAIRNREGGGHISMGLEVLLADDSKVRDIKWLKDVKIPRNIRNPNPSELLENLKKELMDKMMALYCSQ